MRESGAATDQEPRRLLTDRLDLRAVGPDDVADLHRLASDPRNSEHIPGGLLGSPAATRAWMERYSLGWEANGLGYWTVRVRGSEAVIGVGGAERRPEFWNLYYCIDADHRGRGYATELSRAAQRAAAAADPDLPVAAWIHADNLASQVVARHLGLADYGLLEPGHWKGEPMHYWADRPPAAADGGD